MALSDAELDQQAQIKAEAALAALPRDERIAKLPKVKEGILKRLKAQAAKGDADPASASSAAPAPADPAPPPAKKSESAPKPDVRPDPPPSVTEASQPQKEQPKASPRKVFTPSHRPSSITPAQKRITPAQAPGKPSTETPQADQPSEPAAQTSQSAAQSAQPAGQPPPPKELPPSDLEFDDIELCGDWPWFGDVALREKLRAAVTSAHAEYKINVGSGKDEIDRICPDDGRILGAGAVLRLGGAHLGGYGEADIASVYRQLSRALHPDKNRDCPKAPEAFKRLTEAADELRQGLVEARQIAQRLGASVGCRVEEDVMERPQEALFAEASRLISAVLASTGEGTVPRAATRRMLSVFPLAYGFGNGACQVDQLHAEWYDQTQLVDLIAGSPVRNSYDCAPKRFRAQFLCALNRLLIAEAQKQDGCVRGEWQNVFSQFPELGIWRELRDQIQEGLWVLNRRKKRRSKWDDREGAQRARTEEGKGGDEAKRGNDGAKKSGNAEKADDSNEPLCLAFANGTCKKGDQCTFAHQEAEGDSKKEKAEIIEDESAASAEEEFEEVRELSDWAQRSKAAIAAILPSAFKGGCPLADPEVQKLCAAMWRDIVEFLSQQGLYENALQLFRTDTSGAQIWAFVPAADLLLVVGDGSVGLTAEGVFCNATDLKHKRKTFAQAVLGEAAPESESEPEEPPKKTEVKPVGPVGGRPLPTPRPVGVEGPNVRQSSSVKSRSRSPVRPVVRVQIPAAQARMAAKPAAQTGTTTRTVTQPASTARPAAQTITTARSATQPATTARLGTQTSASARPVTQTSTTARSATQTVASSRSLSQPITSVRTVSQTPLSARPASQTASTARSASQPVASTRSVFRPAESVKPASQTVRTAMPAKPSMFELPPSKSPARPLTITRPVAQTVAASGAVPRVLSRGVITPARPAQNSVRPAHNLAQPAQSSRTFSQQRSAYPQRVGPNKDRWPCAVCKNMNEMHREVCNVCETPWNMADGYLGQLEGGLW